MVEKETTTKKQRIAFFGLVGIVVVAAAGFIVYDFWQVDQKTKAVLVAPGIITSANDSSEKASEGSETVAPTLNDLSSYKVAADAPRVITIKKLNIAARVKPMGLNSDKTIQAPKNINDAGWYTGSAKPGEQGAMFIDGHASGASHFGLFGYLSMLKKGDEVSIEKGDGTPLSYRVVHIETVPLDGIDMTKILAPYEDVDKGLNLMTCTGKWLNEGKTLDHRIVVYTEQV